jgi:hypothetical protein
LGRDRSALLSELLDSQGWQAVLDEISTIKREWARALLHDLELNVIERRGYILAQLALDRVLQKVYNAAGRKWPEV